MSPPIFNQFASYEATQARMDSHYTFFYFAFTYRFFFTEGSGPAKCERDVLKT